MMMMVVVIVMMILMMINVKMNIEIDHNSRKSLLLRVFVLFCFIVVVCLAVYLVFDFLWGGDGEICLR